MKSLEEHLYSLLIGVCPRVYPDYADEKAEKPYIVYHQYGGQSVVYTEGVLADKINSHVQINVWSLTRKNSNEISRQIELALVSYAGFQAQPMNEISTTFDDTTRFRGSMQDFSIWADRTNI